MQRRPRFFVPAALLALSASSTAIADTPTEAARDIAQAFHVACTRQDAEAVAALYTEDAIVIWPPEGAVGAGPSAGRDFARRFCTADAPPLELVSVEGRDMGDGKVLAHGIWKQTVTMPDGTKHALTVRTTEIIVERDGRWKYLVDHASIGVPAAAPAAAPAPGAAVAAPEPAKP